MTVDQPGGRQGGPPAGAREGKLRELDAPPSVDHRELPDGDDLEVRDDPRTRGLAPDEPGTLSQRRWRRVVPGIWFLALVLPVGLWLLFSTPPFQGLDEIDHFYRTYTISQGEMVTQRTDGRLGGFVPTCVTAYQNVQFRHASEAAPYNRADFWRQPVPCTASTTFAAFPNSAFYSPVSYLPQALGVFVARSLVGSVPVIFYAGRLAAFLAFLAFVFFALQIAPRAHALLFVVGAWPMTLLVATTYSADTMVIGLALLTVAAVLRAREEPEAWWPALTAFVAILALSLCKSTYFALAPLLLLVPARMFRRRSLSWAAKGIALGVVALATWGWYTQIAAEAAAPAPAADPHAQMLVILHRPLWYAHFIVNMVFTQAHGYPTWETFAAQIGFFRHFDQGEPFGPPWVLLLGVVLLTLAYAREARMIRWSWSGVLQASLPIVLVVVNFLLIFTAIFVEATTVKNPEVGLQGRYFLPLVTVPVLSLAVLSWERPRLRSVIPFIPFLAAMQAWLLYDVHLAFYR